MTRTKIHFRRTDLTIQGGNKINVSMCLCVCVNEFLHLTFYMRWTKTYVERIFVPKTYVRHTYLHIDVLRVMNAINGCH
jgi:hypothetical protein